MINTIHVMFEVALAQPNFGAPACGTTDVRIHKGFGAASQGTSVWRPPIS